MLLVETLKQQGFQQGQQPQDYSSVVHHLIVDCEVPQDYSSVVDHSIADWDVPGCPKVLSPDVFFTSFMHAWMKLVRYANLLTTPFSTLLSQSNQKWKLKCWAKTKIWNIPVTWVEWWSALVVTSEPLLHTDCALISTQTSPNMAESKWTKIHLFYLYWLQQRI